MSNFNDAATELELANFGGKGKGKRRDDSTRDSNSFKKFNFNVLGKGEQNKLTKSLMKYQISLAAYVNTFQVKRSYSNSLISEKKRFDVDSEQNDLNVK
jgi:hypothetical protein